MACELDGELPGGETEAGRGIDFDASSLKDHSRIAKDDSFDYRQVEGATLTPERALAEAQFFIRLVRLGKMSTEQVREAISVPPPLEARLVQFVRVHSTDGRAVRDVLTFRRRVLVEFEKLLALSRASVTREPDFALSCHSQAGDLRRRAVCAAGLALLRRIGNLRLEPF